MTRFEGARYLNLATFKRDGSNVPTPVWFAALDGYLYAFSERRAGKIKRLRRSPRARVAVCNARGSLRGEWIEANAHIVDDPATEARVYAALLEKYGWQMRLTNLLSTLGGRIRKRAVIRIEV